ncbi:MAG: hypothetical protein R6V04_14930 [bacterium]
MEAYHKNYDNYLLDPRQPEFFLVDEVTYHPIELISKCENLVGEGKAMVTGVEMLIQKKLTEDIYGMISGLNMNFKYKVSFDFKYLFVIFNKFSII